ncbi:MAG: hypothetical protein MJZ90_11890 [Bacteroidales bacterium]|nr:hypothetical protein [Bacteroidales bacterium]
MPKSGCVSVMFRGALMRVARAACGASLCQEKPGMQPDVVPELEAVAFYYCFALTEDGSVRGCMRASGSKVAKANAANDFDKKRVLHCRFACRHQRGDTAARLDKSGGCAPLKRCAQRTAEKRGSGAAQEKPRVTTD